MVTSFKQFFFEQFYNDTLHPRFWDEQKQFDPEVREKLLQIAKDVSEDVDVVDLIDDIQLTGSLSNFNYTDFSDLDVHILLDYAKINKDEDLVKSALDGKRFIWNLRHDIKIGGYEVEIYFQDIHEPHMASGLYSLQDGEWLREPKFNPPEVDSADVMSKADQIKRDIDILNQKVNEATQGEDINDLQTAATKIRKKISKMRKDSLEKDGEFGVGNLAFKELRNSDYIEKIIDIDNLLYDKLFTDK
jgi:hypothetical protein